MSGLSACIDKAITDNKNILIALVLGVVILLVVREYQVTSLVKDNAHYVTDGLQPGAEVPHMGIMSDRQHQTQGRLVL